MPLHQEPFNPDWDFKAGKSFRFAGRAIVKGTPVDKTVVDVDHMRKLYETHHVTRLTDDDKAAGVQPIVVELSDAAKARIQELVDGNSREELNKLAADIEGADALPTKADVAAAIVKAEAGAN